MAINLNEKCTTRVVELVANNLDKIVVENNMFLNRFSCFLALYEAEKALPASGTVHDQIVNFVSDNPLIDFVTDILAVELREKDQYESDAPQRKLVEIEGFEDLSATAERLVSAFESLPWKYTHTVELPAEVSELLVAFIDDRRLSGDVRLVAGNKALSEEFPLNSSNEKRQERIHRRGLLFADKTEEYVEGGVYVQIKSEGFVDQYGSSLPAFHANQTLRAFCGLGLALRLFDVQYRYSPFRPKSHFLVHRQLKDKWLIDGKYDLEEAQTRSLNRLSMHTLGGKLNNDKVKREWTNRRLADIEAVLSAGEKAEALRLASQWLFDSYTGRDELLNFVQAMVVLEILLGDEGGYDELGLGQVLRNRCAYLIGNSQAQRSELLEKFKDIYRIRSQIVHRGKHRLSAEERGLFSTLRWMCRRVIQEEVRLLQADKAQEKTD